MCSGVYGEHETIYFSADNAISTSLLPASNSIKEKSTETSYAKPTEGKKPIVIIRHRNNAIVFRAGGQLSLPPLI